ncbi:hypothetical protein H5U98_07340 [Mycolicibacterium boenickei]|uniref:Integral membrane protein n=1 Tax=Mycolicibacterium boenickei TaxID=146017 RepID=A0AAX3A0J3_9MYCO|nr:hypothetical protein [Mycolicibacterium boenickei]PEG58466.1 hypothetical protein CQY21_22600 [Mycolicibacterium boenickei]UNC01192.1 hypothetical protein H5U98_07340 [Mycolicibacterium boenickei]BBX91049.1 hypothetical protein MBOE_26980 [Mycolicibacterium boenickei]
MTAILNRPHTDSTAGAATDDFLLRFALRADATVCAGVGLLVAMAADQLARIAGLSATAGWFVGAALVGYGALLYVLAGASRVRRVGIAVLAGNVSFAIVTSVAIATGWLALTGTGDELVLGFVGATVVLAWLQYRGVRRLA